MKLSFRQSGGFAGLNLGCELDTETLPRVEADELVRLVRRAELEKAGVHTSAKGRDLVSYEITLEEQGKKTRALFDDMTVAENARALLDYLSRRVTAMPLDK
jgi:hypothetical protein